MKLYVASSWRNARYPGIVERLVAAGHEVYDFRNPPSGTGFGWSQVDPDYKAWTPAAYRDALHHPTALAGFRSDHAAMEWAEGVVLVLPCGRSAHLELGWFCGRGRPAWILLDEPGQPLEPELMYLEVAATGGAICLDVAELLGCIEALPIEDDEPTCWCGEANPHYDDTGLRETCGGSGELECLCGGDGCVCHNHGTAPCLGCADCDEFDEDVELGDERAEDG